MPNANSTAISAKNANQLPLVRPTIAANIKMPLKCIALSFCRAAIDTSRSWWFKENPETRLSYRCSLSRDVDLQPTQSWATLKDRANCICELSGESLAIERATYCAEFTRNDASRDLNGDV